MMILPPALLNNNNNNNNNNKNKNNNNRSVDLEIYVVRSKVVRLFCLLVSICSFVKIAGAKDQILRL
jgi:hypothetical protein